MPGAVVRSERTTRRVAEDGGNPSGREDVGALLACYALSRDVRLRDELVACYDPLAVRWARQFAASSQRESVDDLVQVARLGLLHAIDRFDPGRERLFVAFAHATVLGELKRHVRDHTWRLRVPRTLQEQYLAVIRAADDLTQELGRSPRAGEVAARTGLTVEEVLEGIEVARSVSLRSLDQPNGPDGTPFDPGADDPALDRAEIRRMLAQVIARLPETEQHILRLRFDEELTQLEIAERVGVSQMQVSRVLARTLSRLRVHLADLAS